MKKIVLFLSVLIVMIFCCFYPNQSKADWRSYAIDQYLDADSLLISNAYYQYIIDTSTGCYFYSYDEGDSLYIDTASVYPYMPNINNSVEYYVNSCVITNNTEPLSLHDLYIGNVNADLNYFITEIDNKKYKVAYGASCSWLSSFANNNIKINSYDSSLSVDDTVYLLSAANGWQTCALNNIEEIDETAPTSSASPAGGTYTSSVSVTLSATDNKDASPDVYYTINGSSPTILSGKYYWPLSITQNTTLQFFSVDESGNQEAVRAEYYIIDVDSTAPASSASPAGGTYTSSVSVTLSATDNKDASPKIYYTMDGSIPSMRSNLYISPLDIAQDATLKFFSVDSTGNRESVKTEIYSMQALSAEPIEQPKEEPPVETVIVPPISNENVNMPSIRKVSNVRAYDIQKVTTKITWRPAEDINTIYIMQLARKDKQGNFKKIRKVITVNNKKKIKYLKSQKKYYVRVRAQKDMVKGSWSKWVHWTTK